MKRILFFLLTALLLAGLAGCAAQGAAGNGEQFQNKPSEANVQNSTNAYGNTNIEVTSTYSKYSPKDNDHHFRSEGPYAWITGTEEIRYMVLGTYAAYYDAAAENSGVLCGRPECLHEDWTCNGYMNTTSESISFYDGKLYWLGFNQKFGQKNGPRQLGIWRMDQDGTNRELLKELSEEVTYMEFYSMTFHRGMAYLHTREQRVTDGVPETLSHIYATDLTDSDEFTLLLSRTGELEYEVIDHYIYVLSYVFFTEGEPFPTGMEISRFDLDTGETEWLLRAEDDPGISGHFYVSDDLTVYVSAIRGTEKGRLFRLEDGVLKPILLAGDEPQG